MAGRRSLTAINWAALVERIPETEKAALAAFKAKSDFYLRKVQANPESPPAIDWAYYKNHVKVSGLVDKFQKEYASLKVSYPEDKYSSQLDGQEQAYNEAIQKFIEESNKRIAKNQEEIKHLEGLLRYGQMTMEDFRDAHPELALDPINRPTIWPHTEEFQPGPDDNKEVAAHH